MTGAPLPRGAVLADQGATRDIEAADTANPRRTLRSSVPVLTIAYGISAASSFLLTLLVGRLLGAAALGVFALGNSVARIFYAGTDLGVAPHLTRVVSRDRAASSVLSSLFVSLRLALMPVAVLVAAIVGRSLGHGGEAAFCVIAVAQGFISIQVIYDAVVQAHEQQVSAGLLNMLGSLWVVVGCAAWFSIGAGLISFLVLYAGSLAVAIACSRQPPPPPVAPTPAPRAEAPAPRPSADAAPAKPGATRGDTPLTT